MGFCGCTLQTTAIVAAVFGIIESLAGLIAGSVQANAYKNADFYPFSILRNVFISAALFNSIWLVATIVLIIGIVKENAYMHRVWVRTTSMILLIDLAHTIALIVGFVNAVSFVSGLSRYSSKTSYYYYYIDSSEYAVFAVIVTAVSRGSVLLWIVNLYLTIYTAHRANEIERGPLQPGTVVHVYGQQPNQPYPMTGQTIIVQHTGPSTGMPPNYDQQQPQYGQPQGQYGQPQGQYGQPQGQYGQPQGQYGQPQVPDPGIPSKY